jgi:hypothetical protein
MNHHDPAPPRVPHPFFHTMVMMGSALALGCGGISGSKPSDDDAGGGTGTGGTSGGTAGTRSTTGGTGGTTGGAGGTTGGAGGTTGGTAGTTGGTATAGTGGTSIVIGTGGTGNVLVTPGPFSCAPETWRCNTPPSCAGRDYVLPSDCMCDGSHPASAADCAPDQSFVCRQAGYNESYQPFTEPVPFSCACVPGGQSCEATCDQAFGDQGGPGNCVSTTTGPGTPSVLCGCAQIVLR